MSDRADALTRELMSEISAWHEGEGEYLQAVEEVVRDVITVEKADSVYAGARVLRRLAEPDRIVSFRVEWLDDKGDIQVNRGWRVQHSNLMGPYKGGLRFHPSVTRSVLKFLAFEQTFKNALTDLPLGGGKGGADFDPSGRSDGEVMRFCQAFMSELAHHIGPTRDVPAGDIGVGPREIGYLASAYKRITGQADGALTGKTPCMGGSALRVEATGYGLVYFLCAMLGRAGEEIEGKRVAVSGKGNVARHAARKALKMGARVVSLSDSGGLLEAPDGFSAEALDWIAQRADAGQSVESPPGRLGFSYRPGKKPWQMECDVALPCATQNELDADDARALADGGCRFVVEGANMPVTNHAAEILARAGILHAPGKAANAGGVAVSALEMRQNAAFRSMPAAEVDDLLRDIMVGIHRLICEEANRGTARSKADVDYPRGANVASYRRLARAVVDHGPR
ncbi:MAG: NADP-specific glutamate dehydrogenase [Aliihoeflea sp.]